MSSGTVVAPVPDLQVLHLPTSAAAVDDFQHTDLGNAERLVAEHGDDLRYVPGFGWFGWDERRWRRDVDGEIVRRMAATIRGLYGTAERIDDPAARKSLAGHARRSESEGRLKAAISLASVNEQVVAASDELDADPWRMSVANGTLDLRSAELYPHEREHLITKLAPVEFSPEAEAPLWNSFLERTFAGSSELISFARRAVGYSLTGHTGEQVLFILFGSGANGKTTFLEVLRALFGEYGQQTPAETFLERRDTIPNDIARLPGARFVAAAEAGEGRRLNETVVKRLTGGDTMTARFMRAEFFEFRPTFKPWLATNHRPVVRGTDEAIWRRLRLIPFDVTIPEGERDADLSAKLRAELPGILRWALAGCLEWQRIGLDAPDSVRAATAEYRADMDVLGSFLDERCVLQLTAQARAGDLYTEYKGWAEASGEHALTQRTFGQRLKERGLDAKRGTGGIRWWMGVGLRSDA